MAEGTEQETEVTPEVRAALKRQTPWVLLTDSLESARSLEQRLVRYGKHTMVADVSPEQARFAVELLSQAGLVTLIPKDLLSGGIEGLEYVVDLTDGAILPEQVLLG